jgi:hypothetical protein
MSSPALAAPGSVRAGNQAPSQQDIANLAYALWQQRGSPDGSSEQDWIEAENQLRNSSGQTSTSSRR